MNVVRWRVISGKFNLLVRIRRVYNFVYQTMEAEEGYKRIWEWILEKQEEKKQRQKEGIMRVFELCNTGTNLQCTLDIAGTTKELYYFKVD